MGISLNISVSEHIRRVAASGRLTALSLSDGLVSPMLLLGSILREGCLLFAGVATSVWLVLARGIVLTRLFSLLLRTPPFLSHCRHSRFFRPPPTSNCWDRRCLGGLAVSGAFLRHS